jgi:2-dehydro-3-deoxyphosphogluconate aldolase/(4S)-4-hydroxy-2-oxoglutarate aldolase
MRLLGTAIEQMCFSASTGVNLDITADLIRAGAAAVGVGSALINLKLLESGDFVALTERARRFVEKVARGRGD